ncbi:MAG: helix-turn-helix transcriptional regulator [Anaerolineales bacterium]|nr:helix-turn-helix transcriptional regulator [Anaerolineales bacterium]
MVVKLRLKEIAEGKNVTISEIQRNTGLTMGMVRRYWYNKTSSIKLDALGVLANYLKIKPSELIIEIEGDKEF